MHVELGVGLATAVGSLPHVDPVAAAELSLRQAPEPARHPVTPDRSPWESMLGQAVAGLDGVTLVDRRIALVGAGPDAGAAPETDLGHEAFCGLRTFLEVARGRTDPVKWQVTGPVTLGLGLLHAGLPVNQAFDQAQIGGDGTASRRSAPLSPRRSQARDSS